MMRRARAGEQAGGAGAEGRHEAGTHRQVDGESEDHEGGGGRESGVESESSGEPAGEQRAEQGADVDAQVEDLEGGVATHGGRRVGLSEDGDGRGLEQSGAGGDEQQAGDEAEESGEGGQGQVSADEEPGAGEEGAFGAEDAVADPSAGEGAQVEEGAVGADEGGGLGGGQSEATVGGLEVEVVDEDGLHAVEAESLPHLDAHHGGHGDRVGVPTLRP